MLRFDPEDVTEVIEPEALSTPPEVVVRALTPLLTEARRARIEAIVAQRSRAVVPVLDGLIDPHNIAAVLRSAEAFGVQDVHIVERNAPFLASRRVAQGTQRWLRIVRHGSPTACVAHLRQRGYRLLLAGTQGDVTPADLPHDSGLAIVFGNEHAGVSSEFERHADGRYTIPMRGFVESLNVSVATAITLQAATENRRGDLTCREQLMLRARFMMLSVDRSAEIVAEYRRRRS